MEEGPQPGHVLRFGPFEADLEAGQLRKNGVRVKLPQQPFQVLVCLLERSGRVVTREALIAELWPHGTVVEYEHSLGTAINKIRQALGDSADNPEFVETLPRRGYRFLVPVERIGRPPEERPPQLAALAPQPGATISHYKITEKLGEGGMGVVYKAEDTKLERSVALKFLAAHATDDPEHKARFIREAKAAARLDHQSICSVYEIDEADGQTFLAMAFLEGQTVKDKIAERPLKLEEALNIAIQTAQGLEAAHEKSVVHRDIKSANLMVTPQGQVKIMDFGLAQLADLTRLTKTTTMLGTPAYMSPEQALREPTDRRTDVWSLGVVLYEMLTGHLPFEGEREQAVLYAITNEEPEPVTALRSRLPTEIDAILEKALAKKPEERYQHIADMLVDLRRLEKTQESRKSTVVSTRLTAVDVGSERRQRRSNIALAAGTAAAGLVLGIAATLLIYEAGSPDLQQLVWRDRQGDELGTMGQPQDSIRYPALSPDGKRVAVWGREGKDEDIWIHEVDRPVKTRLTTDEARDLWPTWSPSGDRVGFASGRSGDRDLYVKRSDGSAAATPLLMTPDTAEYLTDWSRDESILLFWRRPQGAGGQGEGDIYYLRKVLDGRYEEVPFLTSEFEESTPRFSPNERFVAYTSDESGRREIYVRSFPDGGGKRLVSGQGGSAPRWRANGKELFYVEGDSLMAVPVTTSPSLTVGAPVALFSALSLQWANANYLGYDVTPDGARFVLWEPVASDESDGSVSIRVVQNWFAEFRDREQD